MGVLTEKQVPSDSALSSLTLLPSKDAHHSICHRLRLRTYCAFDLLQLIYEGKTATAEHAPDATHDRLRSQL